MAFIRIKGFPGRVYVPDEGGAKKHNCKDCFFCQMCSDAKCSACLRQKGPKSCCKKKTKKD